METSRGLFLTAIRDLLYQVLLFKEKTRNIWIDHRKELTLKPGLEKFIEYTLTTEYIPKAMQDYYDGNRHYIEIDVYLLQRVLDKYSLGKLQKFDICDTEKFAKANITAGYTVKSSQGKYLILEVPDNKTSKSCSRLSEKLHIDSDRLIGIKHTYDRYFHVYQLGK